VTAPPKAIAVLISGRGSNLRALLEDSLRTPALYRIQVVLSDQPSAAGLGIAQQAKIQTEVLAIDDFADRLAYDDALERRLRPYGVQLLVLAGFMRILSAQFVERMSAHSSAGPRGRRQGTRRNRPFRDTATRLGPANRACSGTGAAGGRRG
jgi:formyltetrahydrofolate hydrolase